jgi:hypothetical protein
MRHMPDGVSPGIARVRVEIITLSVESEVVSWTQDLSRDRPLVKDLPRDRFADRFSGARRGTIWGTFCDAPQMQTARDGPCGTAPALLYSAVAMRRRATSRDGPS